MGTEGIANQYFYGTNRRIKVGDTIFLDNHRGKVREIFEPLTQDADAYDCFKEGGILIETDEYGLMLVKFGEYAYLECEHD